MNPRLMAGLFCAVFSGAVLAAWSVADGLWFLALPLGGGLCIGMFYAVAWADRKRRAAEKEIERRAAYARRTAQRAR
jgi:hypothetical protein